MEELKLEWKGPYKLNIETPEGMEGLHGLFANLYDSEIYYFGKAKGKYHLFQESKRRYKALDRYLAEKGIPSGDLNAIAEKHCVKYLGILNVESKAWLVDSAENLLIFYWSSILGKILGNVQLRKRYKGLKPFKLVNLGEKLVLEKLGLKDWYEIDISGKIKSAGNMV